MKRLVTISLLFVILGLQSQAQTRRFRESEEEAGVYSRTVIHPDGSRTVDKRDINNKILEKRTLGPDGTFVMKSLFQLNEAGKVINGLVYDGRNRLLYRSEFVYDRAGLLQQERIFEADGTPVRRLVYKADHTGKMKPAFAHTYVNGREVQATSSGDYEDYSTSSSHAYRGGSSGVANTPSAYQGSSRSPSASSASRTSTTTTKPKRRFRLFKRNRR